MAHKPLKATDKRRRRRRAESESPDNGNGAGSALAIFNDRRGKNGEGKRSK